MPVSLKPDQQVDFLNAQKTSNSSKSNKPQWYLSYTYDEYTQPIDYKNVINQDLNAVSVKNLIKALETEWVN